MARPTRNIGNENVDNEIVNLDGSEIMERPEDSVETQLVEVERGGAEELVDAIDGDQLENDVDQLVSHAENVESALNDGGMDERAARATEIAVEDICGRWNIKRPKLGVENYAGSSRVSATRLGLESIIDTAREGIRQLIEWVKRRIAALKDVWRKYVNVGKSIKSRVEKMRKRVGKLTGSADKSEKIEAKKVWQLMFADKVDLQKLRSTSSSDIEALADAIGESIDASLNESDKQFESAFTEETTKPGDAGPAKFTRVKLVWEMGGSTSKFNRLFPSGVKSSKIYGVYGGLVLEYKLPDTNISCIRYVQCKADDLLDNQPDLEPLETKAMEDMLDAIFVAGSQLEDYVRKFSKVERSMDKLKRTLEKATSKAGKEAGKKDVTASKLAAGRDSIKAAKASFENAQEMDKLYRGAMTNYAMGGMAYIQASFAAYNDED